MKTAFVVYRKTPNTAHCGTGVGVTVHPEYLRYEKDLAIALAKEEARKAIGAEFVVAEVILKTVAIVTAEIEFKEKAL